MAHIEPYDDFPQKNPKPKLDFDTVIGFTCYRLCGKDRLYDEHVIKLGMLDQNVRELIEKALV